MPPSTPYVRQPYQVQVPYDRGRAAARMSDLMRLQGEQAVAGQRQIADLQARQGDISARHYQNIGRTIGGGMADLAKYVGEAPERKYREEQRQFERERQDFQRTEMVEKKKSMAELARLNDLTRQLGELGLDDDQMADAYQKAGFVDRAQEYRTKSLQGKTARLQYGVTQFKAEEDKNSRAAQFMRGVTEHSDPSTAWVNMRPRIQALVGADVVLPETYDAKAIGNLMNTFETNEDNARRKAGAASEAQLAYTMGKDKRETRDYWINAGAKAFSAANDPKEWADAENIIKDAPQDVKDMFADTFSEQSRQHAYLLADNGAKGGNQGLTDAYRAWVTEHGRRPNYQETLRIMKDVDVATSTFAPPRPGSNQGWSGAANVLRWYQGAIADLKKEQKERAGPFGKGYGTEGTSFHKPPMSNEEYNRRVSEIETSRQMQLQLEGVPNTMFGPQTPPPPNPNRSVADLGNIDTTPPELNLPPPGSTPAPPPRVAGPVPQAPGTVTMQGYGGRAPAPPPAPPPAPVQAAPAPAPVQAPQPPRRTVTVKGVTLREGDPVMHKGKQEVITKIYPDGTWDSGPAPKG